MNPTGRAYRRLTRGLEQAEEALRELEATPQGDVPTVKRLAAQLQDLFVRRQQYLAAAKPLVEALKGAGIDIDRLLVAEVGAELRRLCGR